MPKATEWYKDLLDKEVTYKVNSGRIFKGIITGFDYYIGITIQNKNDKNHYLVCYNGPMSPLKGTKLDKRHRFFMAAMAKMLRKGSYNQKEFLSIIDDYEYNSIEGTSAKYCPFSQ